MKATSCNVYVQFGVRSHCWRYRQGFNCASWRLITKHWRGLQRRL